MNLNVNFPKLNINVINLNIDAGLTVDIKNLHTPAPLQL